MTAREYINEQRRDMRDLTWLLYGWFLFAIPLFGLLDEVIASIIWWPVAIVVIVFVMKHTRRLTCPYCSTRLCGYGRVGYQLFTSPEVKFFPCCRGELDAELPPVGDDDDAA